MGSFTFPFSFSLIRSIQPKTPNPIVYLLRTSITEENNCCNLSLALGLVAEDVNKRFSYVSYYSP